MRFRLFSLTEVKLALRMLRKQPLLAITSVLALALGIALATTGFTALDAVLYGRLPFDGGDRFVLVEAYTEPGGDRVPLDGDQFRVLADQVGSFEHVGAARSAELNLIPPSGQPMPIRGTFLTPDSFQSLPYAPLLGRTLAARDAAPGEEPVVLIREGLWRRYFGADRQAIGSVVNINGTKRTVVGVMPESFRFPGTAEAWIPQQPAPAGTPHASPMRVFAVLKPGVSEAAATAEAGAIGRRFTSDRPGVTSLRLVVSSFAAASSRGLGFLGTAMTATLILVLAVIAGNIATLTLARAVSRSHELAMRTALGASRARLVTQLVIETSSIALPAAAAGLTASQLFLGWVEASFSEIPPWISFHISPRTMIFVVALTMLVATIAGVLPALKATRADTAGRLAAIRHRPGFGLVGSALIAIQIALAVGCLNGALMMARGVAGYAAPVVSIPAQELLTARVSFDPARPVQQSDLIEAIRSIPGVTSAGLASSLPRLSPPIEAVAIEPGPGEQPAAPRHAPVVGAAAGFLETLGGKPLAGRLFTDADFSTPGARVAIVNEPFVRRVFNGANPLGRRLQVVAADGGSDGWREIVGVVPDLGLSAGDPQMAGGVYLPLRQQQTVYVALRADGDARRLTVPVQSAIAKLNPAIQVVDVIGLDAVGLEDRQVFAGISGAMTALGGMTLGLSAISLYALLSLAVSQRTRETGIRLALGASRGHIMRALMGRAAVTLACGIGAGILLGTLIVQARVIFAFRLPEGSGPFGPPAIGTVLLLCGLAAAWTPARRALGIQPAEALRCD